MWSISHTDPVCFWVAVLSVFYDFLRMVCEDHHVIININKFDRLRPEFHIMVKLQYKSARWHRVLEIMCLTHFLWDPHMCFINEFEISCYDQVVTIPMYQQPRIART